MPDNIPPLAFTLKANGLARVLICDIQVFIPSSSQSVTIKGIWDTGASSTTITKKVVADLGLITTGKINVHTANGSVLRDTYLVSIGLPNKLLINGIQVNDADALAGGDALIGMDIISLGDFIVTNHNNMTCMSFRYPSQKTIDFVQEIDRDNRITNLHISKKQVHGKCLCGSGKEFKNCHGKHIKI